MKTIVILLLTAAVLPGCRTAKEVHKENIDRMSGEKTVQIDSVYVFEKDSIFIRQKGDTVFMDRFSWDYRSRIVKDTILKTDSIYVDKKIVVEKQRSKMSVFWEVLGKISAGLIGLIITIKAVRIWK